MRLRVLQPQPAQPNAAPLASHNLACGSHGLRSKFQRTPRGLLCWSAPVVVLCLLTAATNCSACLVPVFRYALEHWLPDPFELVVVHNQPLDESKRVQLQQLTRDNDKLQINLAVRYVDLASDNPSDQDRAVAARQGLTPAAQADSDSDRTHATSPQLLLFFPNSQPQDEPAWTGALNQANLSQIVESPARSEVAARLLSGDSAVWVLLQSGNASADQAAEQRLRDGLNQQEETLHLPTPQELATEDKFNQDLEIPLQIKFSVLSVAADDADEQVFREMLLNVEPDLAKLHATGNPVVVPIFGRGRSYFALAGDDIRVEAVADSCAFICGPCSCEAKRLNPGRDILLAADWSRIVPRDWNRNETPLPQLTGVGIFEAALQAQTAASAQQPSHNNDARPANKGLTALDAPASTPDASALASSQSIHGLAMNSNARSSIDSLAQTLPLTTNASQPFTHSRPGHANVAAAATSDTTHPSRPTIDASYETSMLRMFGGLLIAGVSLVAFSSIWMYLRGLRS